MNKYKYKVQTSNGDVYIRYAEANSMLLAVNQAAIESRREFYTSDFTLLSIKKCKDKVKKLVKNTYLSSYEIKDENILVTIKTKSLSVGNANFFAKTKIKDMFHNYYNLSLIHVSTDLIPDK